MQSARRHRIAVHTVLSASTAAKFILQEELAALSESLSLATDDGSAGQKALGSDVLRTLVARQPVDRIYSCGGGPFYLPALEELDGARRAPVFLFLESYMACGFGYCHGCAVSRRDGGYSLVCQDGPLYKLAEVKDPCLIYQ
jgi:dihydroorotate dehydrogenase electron transfer subunit